MFPCPFRQGKRSPSLATQARVRASLLNLLLRFYNVSDGAIYINGLNIQKYRLEYLQSKIAVVFQGSFLFYGTIEENIRMAKPEASSEEVIAAAKSPTPMILSFV